MKPSPKDKERKVKIVSPHAMDCDICSNMAKRGYISESKYWADMFAEKLKPIKYKLVRTKMTPNKPTTNYVDSRTEAEREADSKIEVTVTTAKPTTLREFRKRYGNSKEMDEIFNWITHHYSTELLQKIEERQKLFNFIPQDKYGYKRIKATDLDIISLINQYK